MHPNVPSMHANVFAISTNAELQLRVQVAGRMKLVGGVPSPGGLHQAAKLQAGLQ